MPEVITGKNPVLEALKSGRPLNKILLAKNIRNDPAVNEILSRARDQGIPVEFLERQAIDRLSLPSVLPKEGLRQVNTFGKLSASKPRTSPLILRPFNSTQGYSFAQDSGRSSDINLA